MQMRCEAGSSRARLNPFACILMKHRPWHLLLALMLASADAAAHDPGLSRGELSLARGHLELRVAFHESDVRLALGSAEADQPLNSPSLARAWQALIATEVGLRCDGRLLSLNLQMPVADQGNGLATTLAADASGCRRLDVAEPLLGVLLPGHRQILTISDVAGAGPETRLLTAAHNSVAINTDARRPSGSAGDWSVMVGEGFRHILIGYDHLAFLLVLLLGVVLEARQREETGTRTLRRLFLVITAFTLAHSITLGMAATNVIRVPSRPVEALIALSIVVGGVLNLFRERRIKGAWLAFGFGLIHGFGFASAFGALAAPGETFGWRTVAQFNIGVELGQLTVGLPAFAVCMYLLRYRSSGTRFAHYGSALAAALGCIWFFQRAVAG